jgi:hypothetical protein
VSIEDAEVRLSKNLAIIKAALKDFPGNRASAQFLKAEIGIF